MNDFKLDLDSKVILLFENKTNDLPNEALIENYLNWMWEYCYDCGDFYTPWFWMNSYTELWEAKLIASVIVAWLTYQFQCDNLFYTIKDNNIYVDRLEIKERVR